MEGRTTRRRREDERLVGHGVAEYSTRPDGDQSIIRSDCSLSFTLALHVCGHLCDCHDSIFSCPAPISRFSERTGRFTMDPYIYQLRHSCWRGSTFQEQGSHEGTYHGVSLANKNLVKQVQELFRGSIIVPNSYRPVAVSEGQISISYFHTPPPHPFHFPSLSL